MSPLVRSLGLLLVTLPVTAAFACGAEQPQSHIDTKGTAAAHQDGGDGAAPWLGTTEGGPVFGGGADKRLLGDAAIAACGAFGRVDACKACLKAHCCREALTCAESKPCTAANACMQVCEAAGAGDAGVKCQQDCREQYIRYAAAEFDTLEACMRDSCAADCPFLAP